MTEVKTGASLRTTGVSAAKHQQQQPSPTTLDITQFRNLAARVLAAGIGRLGQTLAPERVVFQAGFASTAINPIDVSRAIAVASPPRELPMPHGVSMGFIAGLNGELGPRTLRSIPRPDGAEELVFGGLELLGVLPSTTSEEEFDALVGRLEKIEGLSVTGFREFRVLSVEANDFAAYSRAYGGLRSERGLEALELGQEFYAAPFVFGQAYDLEAKKNSVDVAPWRDELIAREGLVVAPPSGFPNMDPRVEGLFAGTQGALVAAMSAGAPSIDTLIQRFPDAAETIRARVADASSFDL